MLTQKPGRPREVSPCPPSQVLVPLPHQWLTISDSGKGHLVGVRGFIESSGI